jgi:hypothetical protein
VHGLSWIVDENPKVAISHITESLKPPVLKKRIKADLGLSHADLKNDFLKFMQHVIFRAELYADFEESGPPHSTGGKLPTLIEKPSQGSSNRPNSKTIFSPTNAKNISETSAGRNKAAPDCLNPDCSLKHYLKECSLTSPSRKDELFAELYARLKKNGGQRMTRRDINTSMTPTPRATANFGSPTEGNGAKALRSLKPSPAGPLKACFQSKVDCIALPESGADDNIIPRSLVRSLE